MNNNEQASSLKEVPKHLCEFHEAARKEWIEGSGVSELITDLNLEILTIEEGQKHYSKLVNCPSWAVRGVNRRNGNPQGERYGQCKPASPIDRGAGKKPAKYITASGESIAPIFLRMPNKDFWNAVSDNPNIIIGITEGVKKAGCLLTNGIAAIAITGVTCWSKDGKILPDLKRYLVNCFNGGHEKFYIFHDSDYKKKDECRLEISKLSRAIEKETELKVLIVSWDEKYKGIDDFIVANGKEALMDAISKAQTIEQWEKQFTKDSNDNKKRLTAGQIALEIAEKYQPLWAYHHEQQTWRVFNGKVWTKEPDKCFTQLVYHELKLRGWGWDSPSFIKSVVEILSLELLVRKWETFDPKRFIAFNDCIFDMETREVLEHFSGSRYTSHLPYSYKDISRKENTLETLKEHCPHTYKYMMEAMQGESKAVMKLLAIINGMIKWRYFDLQMFVHIVGKPGSGKGVFTRLLQNIVGRENYQSTKLNKLSDGSTIANIIDKQLVVFPDERTQLGCENILSFTGGDAIGYREIYKSAASAFFKGMLLVISNNPIFTGDTAGIDRRLCSVHFNNPIPSHLRNSKLEELLKEEIPNLVSVALNLSDQEVTTFIKGIGQALIPEFRANEWEMKCQTNTIAAWMNDNLIFDADSDDTRIKDLYTSYTNWSKEANISKPKSLVKFPKELLETCQEWFANAEVERKEHRNVSYLVGVRMRDVTDWKTPDLLSQLKKSVTSCNQLLLVCDQLCDQFELSQGKGCSDSVTTYDNPKESFESVEPKQVEEAAKSEKDVETGHTSHKSLEASQGKDLNWSQGDESTGNNYSQVVTPIAVGDIVAATDHSSLGQYEVLELWMEGTVQKAKLRSLSRPKHKPITCTAKYLKRIDQQ